MTQTTNIQTLRQQAKTPAKSLATSDVRDFLMAHKDRIRELLPKTFDDVRLVNLVMNSIRTNKRLQDCNMGSLYGAAIQCAILGLEPNTPLGHAYLVPFRNNKKGTTDVQVIFGYQGLIDLARRSGQIVSITAHEVCEHDLFEFEYGLDEKLKHVPARGDRGDLTHFYAVAKFVGGGHAFEVMTTDQVLAIRDASANYARARDKKATIWAQHFEAMGRKTVIRRLFKYLPVSIEVSTARALDEQADAGRQHTDILETDYAVIDDDHGDTDEPEKIEHQAEPEPQPEREEPRGDEWPRQQGQAWVDSAGEVFNADLHAWSDAQDKPAMKQDGTFRRRRGAKPPQPKKTDKQAAFSNAINEARTLDELDLILDDARNTDGVDTDALMPIYQAKINRLNPADEDPGYSME